MRVVILCHKFRPSVGGLQTYTERLTSFLHARGHRVDVFTTQSPSTAPRREQVGPDFAISRFPTRLASHFPFHFMPQLLLTAVRSELRSADVIHSVGYHFFPTVLGYWVSSVFHVPHVVTPVFMLNPETWQRRLYDRVVGRRLVRDAYRLIIQSERERELLHTHHFALPAHQIIPFGVDATRFKRDVDVDTLRQQLNLADEKVVLVVGKIMSSKGAFKALDALRLVLNRGLRVRLVMVGEVHDRQQVMFRDHLRANRLDSHVTLTGAVSHDDGIAQYYQLADAILFPSQYEQFGIVAIEAAASGRPILGTPVGVMQDLIPRFEIGLLHQFDDVEQLAANLQEVLSNPRYQSNAHQNRAHILQEFDWEQIAERTESVYAEVTRGSDGH